MKQRLIGAAVIIALVVIFFPMLIGGPSPDSDGERISTDVPQRNDRQFEARDLTLPSPSRVSDELPPAANASADDENRVATVDTTDAPPRMDAVSGQPVGILDAAVGNDDRRTAPAQDTPPTTAAKPAEAATTTAPAAAAPAEREPVRAPVAATGRWAVNLGSYANADNASKLVSQLKQHNLPAYSEASTLDGKTVQRVRLGPFAQRAEAESARLSVQKVRSDLPTGVVSLEGESAPVAAKPAVAEGFAVQLGALRSQADANALRDRARKAGFAGYVERVETSGGVLWRVRVGPEVQRAGADRLKTEVKSKLGIDGNVVPHP